MNSRSRRLITSEKALPNQSPARRDPRQERARHKVELMFEAAMRLLEEGEVAALTTNAVAERAGVSIGTLYQYFDDKHALLDALVARELGAMSTKILAEMEGGPPTQPGDRLRHIVRAVIGAYGGRTRVHRRLLEHALTHTSGGRLSPLFAQLIQLLGAEGIAAGSQGKSRRKLSTAQAFVLTHAIAGVLRTLAATQHTPPVDDLEDELVRLAVGYVNGIGR